jgi:N-acetylneuraminate lyase
MNRQLTGLIAATYTPMHGDGSLALGEIPKLVAHLERAGVSGIYVCGSTGEGMSLTGEERRQVTEAFVAAASPRMATIVQVGHNSLAEARELAGHAQEIGADVISATAPSYYKITTNEMLVECMAEVAAGAPKLPFYYYHIPILTGATLDMARFLELAGERIPTLAGLKYTAPQIHEFQACRDLLGSRWDIVWGTDEMLLSALVVGARGAIGSTYNIAAPLYNQLIEAYQAGELVEAQRLQAISIRLIALLKKYPFHAAVKCLLSQYGVACGPCRTPQESLTAETEQQLLDELEASGFSEMLDRWFSVDRANGKSHVPRPKAIQAANGAKFVKQ